MKNLEKIKLLKILEEQLDAGSEMQKVLGEAIAAFKEMMNSEHYVNYQGHRYHEDELQELIDEGKFDTNEFVFIIYDRCVTADEYLKETK